MTAGTRFFLLLYLMTISSVRAADPFSDPDPDDDNVTVNFAGFQTTIYLKENNEENIKIALVNDYPGTSPMPIITDTGSISIDNLGVEAWKEDDKWYLRATKKQDYESGTNLKYSFRVQLNNRFEPVNVNIVNVDDTPPYFDIKDTMNCKVEETFVGETGCMLIVRDADGILDNMDYYIEEGGASQTKIDLTEVKTKTCTPAEKCIDVAILINEHLDFLTQPVHSVTLYAKDQGGNTGSFSYIVQVQAINKNVPKITPESLHATIDEGISGFLNFEAVENVVVDDNDSGEFGQFQIKLEDISAKQCLESFAVIPSGGYITSPIQVSVNKPLDYENEACRSIKFKIVATEEKNSDRFGTAEVTVDVKNVIDETPVFDSLVYVFELEENLKEVKNDIGTVTATDADGDEIDAIQYSLSNNPFMEIDQDGKITSKTVFDFEVQPEITVTALATDKGGNIGYAQITLEIIDVNDERPVLQILSSNQPNVEETTEVGQFLEGGVINATDPDAYSDLNIYIDWKNSRATKDGVPKELSVFENCIGMEPIKEEHNEMSMQLTVNKPLDWREFDTLTLAVTAQDKNTSSKHTDKATAVAMFTIHILDVNNFPPVLSTRGSMSIDENKDGEQMIGTIVRTDEDGPGNDKAVYEITCDLDPDGKYVRIQSDSNTGFIYNGKVSFDYEVIQQLNCVVFADNEPLNGTLDITIKVNDLNDEKPRFTGGCDAEKQPEGTYKENKTLCIIQAEDLDKSPQYSRIYYTTDNQRFKIDPDNGTLYVAAGSKLDYEDEPSPTILVTITDCCNPQDSQSCECSPTYYSESITVTINLIDINDNSPYFIEDQEIQITVTEEVQKDGQLGLIIEAADDDKDVPDQQLTFTIDDVDCKSECSLAPRCQNPKELFKIEKTPPDHKAPLLAADNLMDCWGNYELTIKVDDGEPNNEKPTKKFKVIVEDVNNNAPEFETPSDVPIKVAFEGNEVGEEVINNSTGDVVKIIAVDDYDKQENGTLGITFSLTGDDRATKYFRLKSSIQKPNVATLELLKPFELDATSKFELVIEAKNGIGDDIKSNTKNFPIKAVIVGEEPPFFDFDDRTWNITFKENTTNLLEKMKVNATDLNNEDCIEECGNCEEQCQDIFYYLYDQYDDSLFELHKTDKVLKIKDGQVLDREELNNYTLIIVPTNGEPEANIEDDNRKLTVNIMVEDIIDTAPVFNQTLYTGGINIGDKSDTLIATIYADDKDLQDEIKYKITGTTADNSNLQNINSPFVLQEDSGQLILNFDADDNSLTGFFTLNVLATDKASLTGESTVKVYMITDGNILTFRFYNSYNDVQNKRHIVESVFQEVLNKTSRIKRILKGDDNSGDPNDEYTNAEAYFLDTTENKPIEKESMQSLLNAQVTFNKLCEELIKQGLNLQAVKTTKSEDSDMTYVMQTILIVVSVVLGSLVIILFAAFFFRTRSLNRRLEALSTTKFGSQDSGLNRVGMAVPNTNQHAVEGSNPVWGNEDVGTRSFDNISMSSGDSDLIGVEENPEFSQGMRNGAYTPDIEAPRRPTGHPMLNANFDPAIANIEAETSGRRESVNPLAASGLKYMNYENDYDYVDNSARSSDADVGHNNNFSFLKRENSTPTTEL